MWLTLLVARHFYDQEEYEEADGYYRSALDRDNKFVAGYLYRGRNFYRQNKFREAQEMLAKAVELDPLSSKAHNFLAVTLRRLNEYGRALDHHERATKFEPQSPYEYNAFAYTISEARRMGWKGPKYSLSKAREYLRHSEELFGARKVDYAYILEHTRGAIELAEQARPSAIQCFWLALNSIDGTDSRDMMPKKREEKRLEAIYHLGVAHHDMDNRFHRAAWDFFDKSLKSPEIQDRQRLPYYWFTDANERMQKIAEAIGLESGHQGERCAADCCQGKYPENW